MRLPATHFERLYATQPDPWQFATSAYERRKYDLTLAALPRARYRAGFEPGCSIGVFSADLATRCERLLCTDIDPTALGQASRRLGPLPHVEVRAAAIPEEWPDEHFDLVVLGEMGYYFDRAGLADVMDRVQATLEPGGSFVAVHWRGPDGDALTPGDEVHALVRARPELERMAAYEERAFLLDVFRRR